MSSGIPQLIYELSRTASVGRRLRARSLRALQGQDAAGFAVGVGDGERQPAVGPSIVRVIATASLPSWREARAVVFQPTGPGTPTSAPSSE